MKLNLDNDLTVAYGLINDLDIPGFALTHTQQADVDSLRLEKRRRERRALYRLLSAEFHIIDTIDHRHDGSPFLSSAPGKCLSVAHSADIVAAIVADRRVGIDIEQPSGKIERVAGRFLNSDEARLFADPTGHLTAWTIKEAVYKAAGLEGLPLAAHNPEADGIIIVSPNEAIARRGGMSLKFSVESFEIAASAILSIAL